MEYLDSGRKRENQRVLVILGRNGKALSRQSGEGSSPQEDERTTKTFM